MSACIKNAKDLREIFKIFTLIFSNENKLPCIDHLLMKSIKEMKANYSR